MFVLRSEQVISPGSREDYEAYQRKCMEAARHQPGFRGEVRLVYLGNYARRLMYQVWEHQEARLAFSHSDRWVRVPEGLLAGPAQSGFYQIVAQAQDASPEIGHYVIDRHFRVSNGHQEEFEATETGLCDLARGQPGLGARRSLKFLGNDTSYLRISIWRSWEDLQAWVSTAAYVNENDALLGRAVWTSADRYEIVAAVSAGA